MPLPRRSWTWSRPRLRFRLACVSVLAGSAVVTAIALPAQTANAATFSVTNCNHPGAGSLRAEVAAAPSGQAVAFRSSVASCSPILLSDGPIQITKNVTIKGPGAGAVAVSGGGSVQVFSISAAVTATIVGLTIENGDAGPGRNGADDNVSLSASNGSAYPDGGGVGNNGGGVANHGTLTLKDDVVSGNYAGAGGLGGSGTITVSGDSELANIGDGGDGGDGGGIYNTGTLSLTEDTVSGNARGTVATPGSIPSRRPAQPTRWNSSAVMVGPAAASTTPVP